MRFSNCNKSDRAVYLGKLIEMDEEEVMTFGRKKEYLKER
jgi:hypothetical protein